MLNGLIFNEYFIIIKLVNSNKIKPCNLSNNKLIHIIMHNYMTFCNADIYFLILKYNSIVSNRSDRGARVAQWVRSLDLTTYTSPSPIRRGFASGFVNYKKMCTRLAVASDTVYQFGGSLRVLRLLPPLKLVAMIYLKYCWKWR